MLLRWLVKLLREGPVRADGSGRPNVSLMRGEHGAACQAMHDSACAILQFFAIVHKEKLWLSRLKGMQLVECVNLFVAGYCYLAGYCHRLSLCRFHMEPALHMFKHVATRAQETLSAGAPVLMNPAAHLCEQGEDFIGRISGITRRVHARTCGKRTAQRYLIKLHLEMERLGL